MKLFFLILLPFFSFAQASTYEPGDSTWLTSSDTGKVKVYKGDKLIKIVNKYPKILKDKSGHTFRLYEGTPYVGDSCPYTYVDVVDPGAGGSVHLDDAQVIAYGYSDTIESRWIDTLKAHGRTIHYTNQSNMEYTKGELDSFRAACIYGRIIEKPKCHITCSLFIDMLYYMKVNNCGEMVEDTEAGKHWYHFMNGVFIGEYPYHDSIMNHFDPAHINRYIEKPKYDTIGPFWKQVSDLTPSYNPVMAMQLYEVRKYENEWITIDPNYKLPNGGTTLMGSLPVQRAIPHHFAWLDIKKKPFKLFVWNDKTLAP
jgi:hypothetical protein